MRDNLLKNYVNDGYIHICEYFSSDEVELMRAQLPQIFAEESPRRILEKTDGVVRSVYGSHITNQVFSRLVRHPKLVEPTRQILGSEIYVHQFKINAKAAFSGDVWQWHQDYIYWRNEDGMRSPCVVSVAIFLDEVTEFNGPLFLIPGSHHEGVIEVPPRDKQFTYPEGSQAFQHFPSWMSNLTSDLKYSIDTNKMAELIKRYGVVSLKGKAGSTVFFHGNIVHGSANNISPYDRVVLIITYNSVENIPVSVENPRPEFLASRDHRALTPLHGRPIT